MCQSATGLAICLLPPLLQRLHSPFRSHITDLSSTHKATTMLRKSSLAARAHRPQRVAWQRVVSRRSRRLRVSAVLQEDPPKQGENLARRQAQQQQQDAVERLLASLLPPSLQRAAQLDASQQHDEQQPLSLACEPGHVFLLAYGANLAQSTLKRRGVNAVASRSPCIVLDPDWQLTFQHRGGYATLQRGVQPRFKPFLPNVHGVLYQLREDDLRKLAQHEGGYHLADVEVATYDGWRATAKAFVSSPLALLPAEVAPTERYARLLRQGAAENHLDPLVQAHYSSIPTVPSAGLPAAYWDTPAKYIAWAFLVLVGLLVAGLLA